MQLFKILFLTFLTIPLFAVSQPSDDVNLKIAAECSASMSSNNFFVTRTSEQYVAIISHKDKNFNSENRTYSLNSGNSSLPLYDSIRLNRLTNNQLHFKGKSILFFILEYSRSYVKKNEFEKLISGNDLQLNIREKILITDKNTNYNVLYPANEWSNAQNECTKQISEDKTIINIKRLLIIIGILIGLYVLFLIMKVLIRFVKRKAAQAKEKAIELKKEKDNQRIRDIAEEEAVRASVKKSIEDSEDNELEDLQNLINKAVASGDSETAQALLKILNKKKVKH